MAQSHLLFDLEENLCCPVCLDVYEEPIRLQCEHTLCKFCVDQLVGNDVITCPICREKTDETNLKKNLSLLPIVDLVKNRHNPQPTTSYSCQVSSGNRDDPKRICKEPPSFCGSQSTLTEKSKLCELCETLIADHFCLECKKILCKVCVMAHVKLSGCSKYDAQTLQEAGLRKINLLEYKLSTLAEKTREFESQSEIAVKEYFQRKQEGIIKIQKAQEEVVEMVNRHFSEEKQKINKLALSYETNAKETANEVLAKVNQCRHAFDNLQSSDPTQIIKKSEEIEAEIRKIINTLQSAQFAVMKVTFRNTEKNCLASQLLTISTSAPEES